MKHYAQLAMAAVLTLLVGQAQAAIIGGLTEASFAGATTESFNGVSACNYTTLDYGNGLVHTNLNNQGDCASYNGGYGMGTEPSIGSNGGLNGGFYFGSGITPTTFQFSFAGGTQSVGFFGAESSVPGGSAQRNGMLDIDFYDIANNFIQSVSFSTLGTPAFQQYHGFASDGALIGRIVFNNNGHMVLDELSFNVPEPGTLALVGLGLLGLAGLRRRQTA